MLPIQVGQKWKTRKGSIVTIKRVVENRNSVARSTRAAYFDFEGHEVGVWADGPYVHKGGANTTYTYELMELVDGPGLVKHHVQLPLL